MGYPWAAGCPNIRSDTKFWRVGSRFLVEPKISGTYINGSMLLILSQSSVASYNLLHSKYKYRYIFFESFVTGLLMADHQLLVSLVSLHHLVSKVASAAWLCCALAPWWKSGWELGGSCGGLSFHDWLSSLNLLLAWVKLFQHLCISVLGQLKVKIPVSSFSDFLMIKMATHDSGSVSRDFVTNARLAPMWKCDPGPECMEGFCF